jgi:hypothetical protein
MLRKWLLISVIAITGCTSITKYETVAYKDAFISIDGKSIYVLKQHLMHTSSYFYAVVDTYDDSDSLIGAQILKLGLNGNVEKEIELDMKTRGFETWNDSITLLRDTAGSLIKVNVVSGTVSKLQRHEDYSLIIGSTGDTCYTITPENRAVSISKKSLYNDRTDLSSTIIRLTQLNDVGGYQSGNFTVINHLIGESTLCLYSSDSVYLCDVESFKVHSAAISGFTTVLPLTTNRFICSTENAAGVYVFDGLSLTLADSIPVNDYNHITTDSSGINAIRVEYDEYNAGKTNRIVLLNLRTGNEKDLCIGSTDTLQN